MYATFTVAKRKPEKNSNFYGKPLGNSGFQVTLVRNLATMWSIRLPLPAPPLSPPP